MRATSLHSLWAHTDGDRRFYDGRGNFAIPHS